ncbi:hypothetical protein [Amycolatopsis sp. CA-230715]|uniref:hypothetical protein n=1 Tax=Amycolatopsis sp. CA-230715 TaxID=2745196 RepID=UPI001C02B702|nr:hypothetical protein [Amycolatopsis sp. CA-230715]QWF84703.1 hypothetical protein HUW46_08155 [Amycolatopsis sp. CA-230715]
MEFTLVRHLPRKIKIEYTESMCGKVVTDKAMVCHDPARATCARCVDIARTEAFQEQDRFYDSGQW